MKELEVWLKSIATGLNVLAEGIQTIATMVDDMAKAQAPEKPAKTKKATKRKVKPASRKKAKPATPKATKKAKPKDKKSLPATEKVLKAIKQSKAGVDNATVIKKTGLKKDQVANALSQLKKTGKIKSIKRGVHKVA